MEETSKTSVTVSSQRQGRDGKRAQNRLYLLAQYCRPGLALSDNVATHEKAVERCYRALDSCLLYHLAHHAAEDLHLDEQTSAFNIK